MLDTALHLTARLKQPLAPFETPLAPWFEELIEPIYDLGAQVVQDHTSRYLELIVQLHTHAEARPVIEWLEAQRAEQLSLRLAARMLEIREDAKSCQVSHAVAHFRMGMVGLIQGYVALVEPDSSSLPAYPHRGLTLLGQLYQAENASLADNRHQYIETAKQQFNAFEKTWAEVVEAFVQIKVHCRETATPPSFLLL